jgi:hypothetical protein
MNRTLLAIAIAAVAIVGIGVGLLLPGVQSGPLTGAIGGTDGSPTPTPKPSPPVITITGSYAPVKKWNNDLKLYEWNWNLHSVTTYDASHLASGVKLEKVSWTITGTLQDGRSSTRVSRFMQRSEGLPGYYPPTELAAIYTNTIDDTYTWIGCYGPDLCPSSEWIIVPPFTAECTITTTDGSTYPGTYQLKPA